MYPELTPAQRAVYARLYGQLEEVKDRLWAICWQVNPVLCEDVRDDALCGPTSDLLRGVRDYIDWYASEFLEDDDDRGLEDSGDVEDEVVEEGDDDRGLEDSGDVEDEVLEEVDPAGAGASSVTGQGPETIEAGTTDAPRPPPGGRSCGSCEWTNSLAPHGRSRARPSPREGARPDLIGPPPVSIEMRGRPVRSTDPRPACHPRTSRPLHDHPGVIRTRAGSPAYRASDA